MAGRKRGAAVRKSLYRPEYQVFLASLRDMRTRAGLTQAALAELLGHSQNYVTAAERGAARLDGLQIRDWAKACGTNLAAWAKAVERQLSAQAFGGA